jgi:protein SCO1
MTEPRNLSRRAFVNGLALLAASQILPAQSHGPVGRVQPALAVPDLPLICHDGAKKNLAELLAGQATATQLMFTECTTTCPMQGAIFSRVQKLIPDQTASKIQLLSISIDPETDNPAALSEWRKRFQAREGWIAAAPAATGLAEIKTFFGRGTNATDDHPTQVFIINREGKLIWRTFDLPSPESIVDILTKMSGPAK